jgi:hypothetical protein
LDDAASKNQLLPYPIAFYQPVQSAVAGRGSSLGFIVGSTGLAWGFGTYATISTQGASIGDGTYVRRTRPVVLSAASGGGNIDTNDWYLDLEPATAETVPAASTPKMLGVSQLYGSDAGLAFDATVKYKSADLGKSVNNYVFGLVPPTFFNAVKSAPGLSSKTRLDLKAAKADGFVLAQLTPSGWIDVQGQLVAYSQGTANAQGGATNILNGVPAAQIPGARFCIGYGESSTSMLTFQALREVLLLPGASQNTVRGGLRPHGVYMDGAIGSRFGSAVTFKASVVGLSPTGNLQFKDGAQAISGPAGHRPLERCRRHGEGRHQHARGGDALDRRDLLRRQPERRHLGRDPAAAYRRIGATQASLIGPTSSDERSPVIFQATVIGANPTGTVQFKDGAANLGAAVPLVGGKATLRRTRSASAATASRRSTRATATTPRPPRTQSRTRCSRCSRRASRSPRARSTRSRATASRSRRP